MFAFFAPGIDWTCLPRPLNVSPRVQFCPHELEITGYYLLCAIKMLGLQEELLQNCIATLHTNFKGQSGVELSAIGILFAGLAAVLEDVAMAHVQTIERMLTPNSDFFVSWPISPVHLAAEDIYLDAWAMSWLKKERKLWLAVIKAHHSNSLPNLEIQMPSFHQFLGPDYFPPQF